MSDIQTLEAMEAQILEIKAEQTRCKKRTLKNLDKLYELLNGHENSEEEAAVAIPEPVAQV